MKIMSNYVLKYHEIVNETAKAYLVRFNIQTRTKSSFAICIPLGNCSTYPMWTSKKEFDKNSWQFGSQYSKENNFYQATRAINFDIWLPKSKVKLDVTDRHITIPQWLIQANGSKPFVSKEQVAPETYKIYPFHATVYFYQMIRFFFLIKMIAEERMYGNSYGDDPWMENGIGSWHMQE